MLEAFGWQVNEAELQEIERRRNDLAKDYAIVQENVKQDVLRYAKGEGARYVRIVVSRADVSQDEVKTVKSIVDKIERKRRRELEQQSRAEGRYGIEDVGDWVGVQILCNYPSDQQEVVDWLCSNRSPFKSVTPTKEEAANERRRADDERGYRAWQFLVRREPWELPCEVQVKTLLDEAWDGKTHDWTYKRTGVRSEYDEQMKQLSRALLVADEQSEFIKNLIAEEETKRRQRRHAAIEAYLWYLHVSLSGSTETKLNELVSKLEDPNRSDDEKKNALRQYKAEDGVTMRLCRLAAWLAVSVERSDLAVEARQWADSLVSQTSRQSEAEYAEALITRATTYWAFEAFVPALKDLEAALELADRARDKRLVELAKANFAYYVGDAKDESRKERAFQYCQDITPDPASDDTLGFLQVQFGSEPEDVDQGREKLRAAIGRARGMERYTSSPELLRMATAFHTLHDYLALRKLIAFHETA